jgi:hypothetical protein
MKIIRIKENYVHRITQPRNLLQQPPGTEPDDFGIQISVLITKSDRREARLVLCKQHSIAQIRIMRNLIICVLLITVIGTHEVEINRACGAHSRELHTQFR